jgi:hypothetical protein
MDDREMVPKNDMVYQQIIKEMGLENKKLSVEDLRQVFLCMQTIYNIG